MAKIKASLRHDANHDLSNTAELLKRFLRFLVYPVLFWLLGRYGFSLVWLVMFALAELSRRRSHSLRLQRFELFRDLSQDTRPALEKRLSELPSWVTYPDFDRCEWLNKLVQQLWPTISDYAQNIIRTTLEPELKKQLAGLAFERIDLGDFPPRLGGIKIYSDNIRSDEIIFDAEIFYGGDMQIKMKYHSLTAGIKSLYLHGELRLIFKSIVPKLPFVGALEVFFLRTPTIDFDLTDMANIVEIPGLQNLLMLSLERTLQALVVIPNRLILAFMDGINVNQLKFPQPDGVLRIDIVEAKALPSKDKHLLQITKPSLDAYVLVRIGQYKFKTHVQKSLNPKWNETFEVPVEESNAQHVQVTQMTDLLGVLSASFSAIDLRVRRRSRLG